MGFFKKAWNWVRGKGFREDEELKVVDEDERLKSLQETEDIQEKKDVKEEKEVAKDKEEEPIVAELSKEDTTKEIEPIARRFDRSGSITKVQERLSRGNISEAEFTPTRDMSLLRGMYEKLLGRSTISTIDKTGRQDNELINILIENRDRLSHRFSAEIQIQTDIGVARMSVDGILAENVNDIEDFIRVGETYTSEELKIAMNNAMKHFESKYGAIGGGINPTAEKKTTVRDISFKMTFA